MKTSYPGQQLRTSVTFPLHSAEALRLWEGNAGDEPGTKAVPGMLFCLKKLKRIHRAATSGDTRADSWLWWLEQKCHSAAEQMARLRQKVAESQLTLPGRLISEICHNPEPDNFTLPHSLISPPGMRIVYLLLDFDLLIGEIIQAHQLAILSRKEKNQLLWQGTHVLRGLITLAQGFRITYPVKNVSAEPARNPLLSVVSNGMLKDDK